MSSAASDVYKRQASDQLVAFPGAEGYTNLERYMNSLVADIMVKENEGGRLLSGNQTYDDAAGIADATACDKMTDGRIYNLQGMAVSNPARGGIYIRDGKKFIKL